MARFWDWLVVHPERGVDPEKCLGCGHCLHGLPRAVAARCPECGLEVPSTYDAHVLQMARRRVGWGVMVLSWGQLVCAGVEGIGYAGLMMDFGGGVDIEVLNKVSAVVGGLGLVGFGMGVVLVMFSGTARRCWSPYLLGGFCVVCAFLSPSLARA